MIRLSPSSLERYALCPGAYWAEQGLPYTESEYNAEGKFMHACLAGDEAKKAEMDRGQRADFNFCQREAKRIHQEVFNEGIWKTSWTKPATSAYNLDGWFHVRRAQAKLSRDVLISGEMDYWGWCGEVSLVIDWKFGRDPVDEATANRQVRAYAILAADGKPGMTVYVAIIQPRVDADNRVTVACYKPEDIEAAKAELLEIAYAIDAANPATEVTLEEGEVAFNGRVPGRDQCKYCKALGTDRCPESRETMTALVPLQYEGVMPSGPELGGLLEKAAVAKKCAEWLEGYAKQRLTAGDEIPGWELKPNPSVRKIESAAEAWHKTQGVLEPDEFMGLCKVGVTDLQNAVADKQGWASKEARQAFNFMMGDAIGMDDRAPSLVRSK